jgi:hypothetical protein
MNTKFRTYIQVFHPQRHLVPIDKTYNALIPDCTLSSRFDLHLADLTRTGHQYLGGGVGGECQCNYYNAANSTQTIPPRLLYK